MLQQEHKRTGAFVYLVRTHLFGMKPGSTPGSLSN
nr:MAG TPA: hypothetical protein [Caudoviricetes sp.]